MSRYPDRGRRDDFRLGIIGCGRLAERAYVPAVAASPGIRAVAVADPDRERRELLARVLGGARAHDGAGEMLEAGGLDGVVVASPPAEHLAAAEQAAAAGVPALVEKPPAESAAAARRMVTLDPAPVIGFNRRFGLGRGLEATARGGSRSGPLRLVAEISYRRRSWDPIGELGDAALDLGPHLVDLALLAAAGEQLEPRSIELEPRRFSIELVGAGFSAALSGRVDGRWRERVELRDGDGALLFRSRAGGLRALLPGGTDPLSGSIAAQLRAWAGGLADPRRSAASPPAEGQPLGDHVASAAQGAKVMATLESALVRSPEAAGAIR